MPVNFKDLFETLKDASIELAKQSLKKYANDAKKDSLKFLNSSKEKLERWVHLLESGDLKVDEFEFLVASQKDLLVMTALKNAGLAAIRIDQFKASLLNLVTDTILHALNI